MRKFLLALSVAVCLPAAAQTPYLVKDINTTYSRSLASSSPSQFVGLAGRTYFVASVDDKYGRELWSTDDSEAGTKLVADILPGKPSSNPADLRVVGNRLLFTARDVDHGIELWTSDGTAAGTRLVKDISPGPNSSQPTGVLAFNGKLFFFADDGTSGRELWTSDGTEAGTRLVKDVNPGSASSAALTIPWYAAAFRGGILFFANDGAHGRELWISDGTAAGTRMVTDAIAGERGTFDDSGATAAVLGDRAFFPRYDAGRQGTIYVTDGTEAGTQPFDRVSGPPPPWANGLTVVNGRLYFTRTPATGGSRIWTSDGTPEGTRPLGGDSGPGAELFTVWPVGEKIYFSGSTSLTASEPWVTDGTDAGTHLIANLAADAPPSSFPTLFTAAGNLLYFHAIERTLESSFWRTDGTPEGTWKLMESGQHPTQPVPVGSGVLLYDSVNGSRLLYSDGTPEGTGSAQRFTARYGAAGLSAFYPFGNTLFTATYDRADYRFDAKLWVTTAALGAPATKLGSVSPFGLIESAGRYYFYAEGTRGAYTFGLWTTDGTPEGTYPIVPLLESDYSISPLAMYRGNLYFLLQARERNVKLWRSDGTTAGTVVVKELPPGRDIYTSEVRVAGDRLFFVVGNELWSSDGTADGTVQLMKTEFAPSSYARKQHLLVAGDRVVFTLDGPTYPLWTSDGTAAGTVRLMDRGAIDVESSIDGLVYFSASDDAHGAEAWVTDGTPAGTRMLFDLNPGPPSSSPNSFTKVGDRIYFSANDGITGQELWALPLTAPVLTVGDARVVEGDSGTKSLRFTVSLAPAASAPVTVTYATSDLTARAGADYDAAAGSITFAPGETSKTISVVVRGDTSPEDNETFALTVRGGGAVRIANATAAGIIEDDDQFADLSLKTALTFASARVDSGVTVSNAGPRAASQVTVKVTATPTHDPRNCSICVIPQLLAGASAVTAQDDLTGAGQVWQSATVSARQPDPQQSNNTITWTFGSNRVIWMEPAYLTVGQTGVVTIALYNGMTLNLTSSDPAIVAVPATVGPAGPNGGLASFTVQGLKEGVATIRSETGIAPFAIHVVRPGSLPRLPGGVSLSASFFLFTRLDETLTLSVTPQGTALNGARATGEVTVTSGGKVIARVQVNGTPTTTRFNPVAIGSQQTFEINYSGDANFLPQTLSSTINIVKGRVTLTGTLEPASGGTDLVIRAAGAPQYAPTGTVVVSNGTTELARVPLVASAGGVSIGRAKIPSLASGVTLTLAYPGDALYDPSTQQLRVFAPRRRAGAH